MIRTLVGVRKKKSNLDIDPEYYGPSNQIDFHFDIMHIEHFCHIAGCQDKP